MAVLQGIFSSGTPISEALLNGIGLRVKTWGAFATLIVDPISAELSLNGEQTLEINDSSVSLSAKLRSKSEFFSSVADMVAGSKEAMTELPEGVLQTTSENLGLVAPVDSALPNPNLEPAPSPIPGCSKANLATLAANQVGSLAKGLEEELLRSPIPSLSTSTMPSSQVPTTPPAHSNVGLLLI